MIFFAEADPQICPESSAEEGHQTLPKSESRAG